MKLNKLTLNIGFNDKDEKRQLKSNSEMFDNVVNALKNADIEGYTAYMTRGGYTHENGQKVDENGCRIEFIAVDKPKVINVAKEIKKILNQEAIYLQEEIINSNLI